MNDFPTDEELFKLLNPGQKDMEDNFIERMTGYTKPKVLETLVSLANSVPPNSYGIIYIGVTNDGNIVGFDNVEKREQETRTLCSDVCYPPIKNYNTRVIKMGDKEPFLAIVVGENKEKPYFTGRAFKRRASSNIHASPEEYQKFIDMRKSILYEISKWKPDQQVSVVVEGRNLGKDSAEGTSYRYRTICLIKEFNIHSVKFYDKVKGEYRSEPVKKLTLTYDDQNLIPKIIISC